jgi:hypothetical protein
LNYVNQRKQLKGGQCDTQKNELSNMGQTNVQNMQFVNSENIGVIQINVIKHLKHCLFHYLGTKDGQGTF